MHLIEKADVVPEECVTITITCRKPDRLVPGDLCHVERVSFKGMPGGWDMCHAMCLEAAVLSHREAIKAHVTQQGGRVQVFGADVLPREVS